MGIPSDRSDLIAAAFVPTSGNPNQPGIVAVNFDGTPIFGGGGIAANQGTPNTVGNAWPVKITDGVHTANVTAAGGLQVDGSAVTQPISAATLPLPAGAATQATLSSVLANQTNSTQKALNIAALIPVAFDTVQVTAVDGSDRPTTVLYKTGGLGGATVATLTIVYDGSGNFQSAVRT